MLVYCFTVLILLHFFFCVCLLQSSAPGASTLPFSGRNMDLEWLRGCRTSCWGSKLWERATVSLSTTVFRVSEERARCMLFTASDGRGAHVNGRRWNKPTTEGGNGDLLHPKQTQQKNNHVHKGNCQTNDWPVNVHKQKKVTITNQQEKKQEKIKHEISWVWLAYNFAIQKNGSRNAATFWIFLTW